ncbi:MAG: hypothetical protein WCH99_11835 [Verrucomicrobiota bacterium]
MTEGRSDDKLFALICLALALGTAALFWPITSHPFILFDDEEYITVNRHVITGLSWDNFRWAFTNVEAANWHPLTWFSHQLDCALFGLDSGAHHFVNLLFHGTNTLLVFVFLRGTTGAVWRSAWVAAFFAWHPLHVESVAWASERKDTLSTFFFLLTLIAYARYTQERSKAEGIGSQPETPDEATARWWFYALALLLFGCGLMSKPMVVTLPFVLLLLDFWPLGRILDAECRVRNLKVLLLEKIPFFALSMGGSVVTYLVQIGGGAEWKTPLFDRLANAGVAYARYVAKTFWPADLVILYPHPKHWPVVLSLGAAAVLVAWTILCVRHLRRHPYLAVGWFWFLGTLVPTIGIVQVGSQSMADRYSYIPSIGFFIALVWAAAELVRAKPERKNLFLILGGGALAGCLLVTTIQITYWRNSISLFLHAIEVTQNNYVAANCLGKAFEKAGDKARALVLYRDAVRIAPRYAQGHFNYAISLLEFGQKTEALEHLRAAAALEPRNPDIQFDLGIFFLQHASWANAAMCFSNSIAIRPGFPPAQHNYASALANLDQFSAAATHYREALRLKPDFADAKKQLDHLLADHPELK